METLTQAEVESEMMRLSALLEDNTYHLAGLAQDAAQAEADFKRDWAKAFLAATGAVRLRESEADLATERAFFNQQLAKGAEKAKRELLYSLRAQLDVLRSISANVRAQT